MTTCPDRYGPRSTAAHELIRSSRGLRSWSGRCSKACSSAASSSGSGGISTVLGSRSRTTSGSKPLRASTSRAMRRTARTWSSPMISASLGKPLTATPSRIFVTVVPITSEMRVDGPSSSCVASASAPISTGRFRSQYGCTLSPNRSSPPARCRYASCLPPRLGQFSTSTAANPSRATWIASTRPSTCAGPASPPQGSPSHRYRSPDGCELCGITVCAPVLRSSTHIDPSGIL